MALRIVLYVVAASQLVLGAMTLAIPGQFVALMGMPPMSAELGYLMAMLGARFIAYGVGMIWLARQRQPDRFWIGNMVGIQLLDLGAGAAYLVTGILSVAVVAFPMFNAAIFAGLLWYFGLARRSVQTT